MSNRISSIKKVFKIEFEEAENDIRALMDYYSGRFENSEITPYVWQENLALLMKEVSCIRELESDLDDWNPPDDQIDPLLVLHSLVDFLKGLVDKHGYPELVKIVIDRIGGKLSRYIEN